MRPRPLPAPPAQAVPFLEGFLHAELARVRRELGSLEAQLARASQDIENTTASGDRELLDDVRSVRQALWRDKEQLRSQETILLRTLFGAPPQSALNPQMLDTEHPQGQQGAAFPHGVHDRGTHLPYTPSPTVPNYALPGPESADACTPLPGALSPQGFQDHSANAIPQIKGGQRSTRLARKAKTKMRRPKQGSKECDNDTPPGASGPGPGDTAADLMPLRATSSQGRTNSGFEQEYVNPGGYAVNRSSNCKVRDVWNEWKHGLNGGPAIETMEDARQLDRRKIWWRTMNDYKYWSKQMRIVHAVKQQASELGGDVEAGIEFWEDMLRNEFQGSVSKLREALGGQKSAEDDVGKFKRKCKDLLEQGMQRLKGPDIEPQGMGGGTNDTLRKDRDLSKSGLEDSVQREKHGTDEGYSITQPCGASHIAAAAPSSL